VERDDLVRRIDALTRELGATIGSDLVRRIDALTREFGVPIGSAH